MHRHVRDHLEEVLTAPTSIPGVGSGAAGRHLADCRECSDEVNAMRNQAALLRELRAPQEEEEPRPGFYARVLERIEAEGPASIWNLFFDSTFGQRLAIASLALAALLCVCLFSVERFGQSQEAADQPGPFVQELRGRVVADEDQPGVLLTGAPDQDSVLVNLVTYRDQ
jgi:hypothetical protein